MVRGHPYLSDDFLDLELRGLCPYCFKYRSLELLNQTFLPLQNTAIDSNLHQPHLSRTNSTTCQAPAILSLPQQEIHQSITCTMARKRGLRQGRPASAKRPSTMKTSPDDTPSLPQMPSLQRSRSRINSRRLPHKIRLMVWSFATLMRKVVLIRQRDLLLVRDGIWDSPAVVRHDLIPLLSACQESRSVVLSTPNLALLPVAMEFAALQELICFAQRTA
jgi:hypothetical protein